MEPNLGLATTRELLAELAARMRTSSPMDEAPGDYQSMLELHDECEDALVHLPSWTLDYRTVDS